MDTLDSYNHMILIEDSDPRGETIVSIDGNLTKQPFSYKMTNARDLQHTNFKNSAGSSSTLLKKRGPC